MNKFKYKHIERRTAINSYELDVEMTQEKWSLYRDQALSTLSYEDEEIDFNSNYPEVMSTDINKWVELLVMCASSELVGELAPLTDQSWLAFEYESTDNTWEIYDQDGKLLQEWDETLP